MKTVTMLEFRRNAEDILRRVRNGERFMLSHRGRAAARLEPVGGATSSASVEDPFFTISQRATGSGKGRTQHSQIDKILYGRG